MANKIRVGMVGITPNRGFSSIAHMPALQALPEFEVVAVCTTRQDTADAAAKHYGVPLAFADPVKLAQHPDVDLVTVCVKVPDHFTPVMAAIDAGKHVYSEWPLGRNSAEARTMYQAAETKGIHHAVGLQGRVSPSINYVRDLIAEGFIGKPLSATLSVNAGNWGATLDRAYQADFANGANLMTITGGHNLDVLCYCLGEFRELSAYAVSQRDRIPLEGTGELVAKNVPDQLVVSGIVGDETVVSAQVRGGMTRGHEFLFEIHGRRATSSLLPPAEDPPSVRSFRCRARGDRARAWRPCRCRRSIDGCRILFQSDHPTMLHNFTRNSASPSWTAGRYIPGSTRRLSATKCWT
jgi:predicted dehydrogenase